MTSLNNYLSLVFQDLGSLLISAYESSLLYDAVMVRKCINGPVNYSNFKLSFFFPVLRPFAGNAH